ncbi:DUF2894 domain-containing protein [Limnohabitans sp.]|jgi:hypothetical protein|uniref:DUF2894 domain-containing protein n=1 Tax=Limnohabitans sp. TaxID=1907725 RepID=UPI0037BE2FC6
MIEAPFAAPELAAFDPIGWHYAEQLSLRADQTTGTAQALLRAKHQQALQNLHDRWQADPKNGPNAKPRAPDSASPSPLAQLVQDMPTPAAQGPTGKSKPQRAESPRTQAFRQQLGHISVQKQLAQAMAQAPQNAGPINSHMLVLRSLGVMREASPDYLKRFMGHVETLLRLDEATSQRP